MNSKDPVFVLLFCIIVTALLFSVMSMQQTDGAVKTPVVIQEGQAVDLANLPENILLPNGMVLESVDFVEEGYLTGTIQAKKVFFEQGEGLRMVWLDKEENIVGYTFLNNPPFGAPTSGEKLGIWPLSGVSQVKFEVWE